MKFVAHRLLGPYLLTEENIALVSRSKNPGVFAFGNLDEQKTFIPHVLGMSNVSVGRRLHEGMDTFSHFKIYYTHTAHEAFSQWCVLYHSFCGDDEMLCSLLDRTHPQHPTEESWKCPVCHAR